jgi:hypothetical protein
MWGVKKSRIAFEGGEAEGPEIPCPLVSREQQALFCKIFRCAAVPPTPPPEQYIIVRRP